MSLDIRQRKRHLLTMVKVASANVATGWDATRDIKDAPIQDAEQYVYSEPVVIEPSVEDAMNGFPEKAVPFKKRRR